MKPKIEVAETIARFVSGGIALLMVFFLATDLAEGLTRRPWWVSALMVLSTILIMSPLVFRIERLRS